ncbi:MAG: SufD family Fe-S cluster assembly protein, partial [Clostridia bacterium]|nr:SufD family Fe-S cluster assembly protein [Clostridia bacterium]
GFSSIALDGYGERLFAVITCIVPAGRAGLECRLPERREIALILRARIADGAKLELLLRVPGHAKTTLSVGARAGENAVFRLFQFAPDGGKALFGGACALIGRGSRFEGHIGYHANALSDLDMNYLIRHEGVETVSALDVSGVISGGGQKRFRGTLDFVRGCVRASGDEREDVLLLDERGVNRTLPVILCGEENVSGTHGASVGRLREDTLFYLTSRGLDRAAIERMMTGAQLARALEVLPPEAAGLWEKKEAADGED